MLRKELQGLEKQIEECLTCAFQKGYNTGTVDRDVEKAYERGLKEAWECADKIAMLPTDITEPMFNQFGLHNIIKNVSPAEAINKIYEYEKQQKTKKAKEEGRKAWIPVSERLPETVDYYLTSIAHSDGTKKGVISWFDGMSFKAEVKAWMPLPEPYKESEDKG